ncbi:MAG: hypothetical protein ACRDZ6_07605 [Acidimicrobiales bacterium]
MRSSPMIGRVVDFDDDRGLGTVNGREGRFGFHCTAIAGGTRRIGLGTEVAFVLEAAVGGRREARRLVTVAPAGSGSGGQGGSTAA